MLFKAHHFGAGYTWGRFNDFEGTFEVDGKKLTSIGIVVKAESVDTNNDKRDKHLRNPDFLDAEQFPTVSFKSTKIDCSGDKCAVTGDLTLHGVTKSITVDLMYTGEGKDPWGGYRQGWEGTWSIDTSQYGIQYKGVGTELFMTVAIEGKKK